MTNRQNITNTVKTPSQDRCIDMAPLSTEEKNELKFRIMVAIGRIKGYNT